MILTKRITWVLCLLFIAGCSSPGQLNVMIKPNINLPANNYFGVDEMQGRVNLGKSGIKEGDYLGIKEKLKQRLISNGFNVVEASLLPEKEKSASANLTLRNPSPLTEREGSAKITERENRPKSTFESLEKESSANYYLIQCKYWGERKTLKGGWVFLNFSASVTNLKTGEVVATADLTDDKLITEVIDDFVNKLSPLARP